MVLGMSTLTSHLVTRNPDAAAAWYGEVLGAEEISRITLPGGQVLTIELRFGDSVLAIADEFPGMGVVSPLTLGGTYGAVHVAVGNADVVNGDDVLVRDPRDRLGLADHPGLAPDLIGGLLLGIVNTLTAQYVGPAFPNVTMFLLLVLLLLVRPHGLLGNAFAASR